MSDVVVVGSLNMDLVVKTDRMPEAGETISGQDFRTIPGGKGANQAAAIARLGSTVSMVGRVGDDVFGRQLLENLTLQAVDTGHVHNDADAPTGTATIIVDALGENRIIVVAGANGRVACSDVDACERTLYGARALVVQFEIPIAAVAHAMELAIRHRVPIVLNPAPAMPVSEHLLHQVDYLILNESEAKILSGLDVVDLPSAQEAAKLLRARGVRVVILTLGERGALLASEKETRHFPTRTVQVVDTTAAGDAFVGGITTSLVRGLPLPDAVSFANGAGTLAVTRFGAQTSLPTAAEVEAFLSSR